MSFFQTLGREGTIQSETFNRFVVKKYIIYFGAVLFVSRTFLKELEAYTDCPELVGRCFLERVSTYLHCVCLDLLLIKNQ